MLDGLLRPTGRVTPAAHRARATRSTRPRRPAERAPKVGLTSSIGRWTRMIRGIAVTTSRRSKGPLARGELAGLESVAAALVNAADALRLAFKRNRACDVTG